MASISASRLGSGSRSGITVSEVFAIDALSGKVGKGGSVNVTFFLVTKSVEEDVFEDFGLAELGPGPSPKSNSVHSSLVLLTLIVGILPSSGF